MLEAGTKYRHIRTGTIYTIVGVGRHKRDAEVWVLAVFYRNPQGELFSRELPHFTGFEFFSHADAPNAVPREAVPVKPDPSAEDLLEMLREADRHYSAAYQSAPLGLVLERKAAMRAVSDLREEAERRLLASGVSQVAR